MARLPRPVAAGMLSGALVLGACAGNETDVVAGSPEREPVISLPITVSETTTTTEKLEIKGPRTDWIEQVPWYTPEFGVEQVFELKPTQLERPEDLAFIYSPENSRMLLGKDSEKQGKAMGFLFTYDKGKIISNVVIFHPPTKVAIDWTETVDIEEFGLMFTYNGVDNTSFAVMAGPNDDHSGLKIFFDGVLPYDIPK